jgi:tRNA C32,U32 (ribose-2'-O)-methylase TrmJ
MEEINAYYICEYDTNIPITTEAEPFFIITDTDIETAEEANELANELEEARDDISQLLEELEEKDKETKELIEWHRKVIDNLNKKRDTEIDYLRAIIDRLNIRIMTIMNGKKTRKTQKIIIDHSTLEIF